MKIIEFLQIIMPELQTMSDNYKKNEIYVYDSDMDTDKEILSIDIKDDKIVLFI